MYKVFKIGFVLIVIIFAGIGAAFTAVFFGMQQGALNVRGSILERNASFGPVPTTTKTVSEPVSNGCADNRSQTEPCMWNETVEWIVVRDALKKDAYTINHVSEITGVPSRMIVAAVIPEQTRFFTDNREVFKRYFEPLKLLVSLSKFSLGVSGIKQDTAVAIENHAQDTNSPFYPGPSFATLLLYAKDEDHNQELFNRLTDEKNHYYSYLYTAVYLKEIQAQWERAGFEVSKRPDVLVTLFNLGFDASHPNPNPQVAGASIVLGGQSYSFGYLGTLFYQSDELMDTFPE